MGVETEGAEFVNVWLLFGHRRFENFQENPRASPRTSGWALAIVCFDVAAGIMPYGTKAGKGHIVAQQTSKTLLRQLQFED
jgi:hypothetical protein